MLLKLLVLYTLFYCKFTNEKLNMCNLANTINYWMFTIKILVNQNVDF